MPTYEYECSKCGTVTEVFQSISAPALKRLKPEHEPKCACHGPVVRRISGGGGLIFKGSGFYLTDYRSDGYKKAAKADQEGSKGEASGGGGSCETSSTGDTKGSTESKSPKSGKKKDPSTTTSTNKTNPPKRD